MSKQETDMSLIRKYLDGALDARAMHQLELRAQDDPFLMDALEGYENAGSNQLTNLADLSSRLHKRTEQKQVRVISWRFMAIAASVLIVMSIGGWLLLKPGNDKSGLVKVLPTEQKIPIATPKSPEPIAPDKANAIVKVGRKQYIRPTTKALPVKTSAPNANVIKQEELAGININKVKDSVAADTTPINEMIVMDYAAEKKKSPAVSVDAKEVKIKPKQADQSLLARVPGVSTTVPLETQNISRQRIAGNIIINGLVVGRDDGMPLPGATVKIKGSNIGTQTDANGRFTLAAKDKQAATLQVDYVGYKTVDVVPVKKDSVGTISLFPEGNQLAEVAVASPVKPAGNGEGADIAAHPQLGWRALKKYLEDNAVSPDGKKGVVRLSFTVSGNGTVNNIRVDKSLSPDADQKAISLIKEATTWIANSKGGPEKVTVKVHFDK